MFSYSNENSNTAPLQTRKPIIVIHLLSLEHVLGKQG
jgi:hypothetical protein